MNDQQQDRSILPILARLRMALLVLRGKQVIFGVQFRQERIDFQKGHGIVHLSNCTFNNPKGPGEAMTLRLLGPDRIIFDDGDEQRIVWL